MTSRLQRNDPADAVAPDDGRQPTAKAPAGDVVPLGERPGAAQPTPLPPPEVRAALRRVIEQLDVKLGASRQVMLTVTGTDLGDGATTIAWWLACLLASSGAGNLLYVDASLQADPGPGGVTELRFAQAAQAGDDLTRLVRPTPVAGVASLALRSVTSGTRPLHAAELVGALTKLRAHHHWIIVDAAPPADSPVSVLLAQASDGVLLVLEASRTDRQQAQATVDLLVRSGAQMIGAVLNKARA